MNPPQTEMSPGPGRVEYVLLISTIMMTVAFAIDSMLPALPAISSDLRVANANDRQLVISSLLAGFGVVQLFIGTLSDAFGRRKLMLLGLIVYGVAGIGAAIAPSFAALLAARFVQGMAAAVGQVIVRSVVRDRFAGRDMAQVMSLASTIFMMAPILAPAAGQLVLEVGPWRWIFGALAMIGFLTWGWVLIRLPETLDPADRVAISMSNLWSSARAVVVDRMSLGYSLAMAMLSCALYGFILSVQQVFELVFRRADLLPLGFAVMASGMAIASLVNAVIVKRFGMRLIGHLALMFFTVVAILHAAIAVTGHESLVSFIILQMVMMAGFALIVGNFGAMAMENMGEVAGMASSLQGSIGNLLGIVFGTMIGQSFNGSTIPLYLGYSICGILALAIVFVTERGQFFVARHAPTLAE